MGLGVRELFDNNIKVHFAGSDGGEIFYAALLAAQTKYRLFSCYKYILKRRPDDDFRLPADHVIRVQDTVNRHVIQDSGLFTLMFGAGKGQTQTLESLTEWQDKLIAFVQQNDLRCTCVELDCQKVLGVREAWYLRERMKKLLDNPQINVFHFEDGMRGLDSLIDFSDYIALSIPELRIIKPKTFREDTRYLTHYIKNRKPEIDIHLLGCTDVKMIAQNSFCTSADSTSWLSGVKYGWFDDGNQKHLAIPLNMEAKNAGSPRKFNDLRFIPISPGYGFLVRDRKHPQKAPGRKKQEKHDAKKHPSGGEEDPRPNEDYEWMYMLVDSVTIPERSFIRASFDTGKATLENICKEAVDGIILKKWTAKEAADYIGKWAVEMTHDYFNTKLSPPKSATTQLTSTQYQPLFDTGRLYNSISYSVEGI